ncbi:MAG TPA: hypothetical protein VGY57_15870, partial [Vicinamibacterales bacterium]|nr:hypothetical protein [Vicinamibacterales bacterium]
ECAERALRIGAFDVAAVGQDDQFLGRRFVAAHSIRERRERGNGVGNRSELGHERLLSDFDSAPELSLLRTGQQTMTADFAEIRTDRIELESRGGQLRVQRLAGFLRLDVLREPKLRPLSPFPFVVRMQIVQRDLIGARFFGRLVSVSGPVVVARSRLKSRATIDSSALSRSRTAGRPRRRRINPG